MKHFYAALFSAQAICRIFFSITKEHKNSFEKELRSAKYIQLVKNFYFVGLCFMLDNIMRYEDWMSELIDRMSWS